MRFTNRMDNYRFGKALGASLLLAGIGCSGGGTPPPEDASQRPAAHEGPAEQEVAEASSATVQQGIDAIQAGDFEKAKEVLSRAVAENDADAQAHFYLGVALDQLGDSQAAIDHYDKALRNDPDLLEARVNLSAALLDAGEIDRSLEVVEAGLEKAPGDAALLLNKAMALSAKEKPQEAAEAFSKAVDASPDDHEVRFLYAQALAQAGDQKGAVAQLEQLVEGSSQVEVLASAADLLGRLDAFDSCVKALDKAISKKDAAELRVRRGVCKHHKKDEKAAQADFEAAVKLEPGFAAAHYYLGESLRAQGNKKAAKSALEKAAELDPEGGIGKAAKKALAKL